MKRAVIVVLLQMVTSLLAAQSLKVSLWDFHRPDGPPIQVIVSEDGTITVYDDGRYIGHRTGGCEIAK